MLNDGDRNSFFRRALARAVSLCESSCTVIDLGAGSGILSMVAASLGAANVVAIEANPAVAALARETIERNRPGHFPASNVTVLDALSLDVGLPQLPLARRADVLVTETFGTMLLEEGALQFLPDARDRLLRRRGGAVVPAGGCQYATLVEAPDWAFPASELRPSGTPDGRSTIAAEAAQRQLLNMSRFRLLADAVFWKAPVGAVQSSMQRLSERICILEVDFGRDSVASVPRNRTFLVRALRAGSVHAVLLDWDIWADSTRSDILSTAPGARGFAGDVAWGQLLQQSEVSDANWQYGDMPEHIVVREGDMLDLSVEYVAQGSGLLFRLRSTPPGPPQGPQRGPLPKGWPPLPARLRGTSSSADRRASMERSDLILPLVGDHERHAFYETAFRSAAAAAAASGAAVTVLDCGVAGGVPALLVAKSWNSQVLALVRDAASRDVLQQVAADNNVSGSLQVKHADARDLEVSSLPEGQRVDVALLEPPGTTVPAGNPFALLPLVSQRLLKPGGAVIPAGSCFEVGLVESEDLVQLFSVPADVDGFDLSSWNKEARSRGIFERLTPHRKLCGPHSRTAPVGGSLGVALAVEAEVHLRCQPHGGQAATAPVASGNHSVEYGLVPPPAKLLTLERLAISAEGRAHALLGRWASWGTPEDREVRSRHLDGNGRHLGRTWTSQCYVQAIEVSSHDPGLQRPMLVSPGETWSLEVLVRQGVGKVTGTAGPEITLRPRPHAETAGTATEPTLTGLSEPRPGLRPESSTEL